MNALLEVPQEGGRGGCWREAQTAGCAEEPALANNSARFTSILGRRVRRFSG